jgi:hypothetical protein
MRGHISAQVDHLFVDVAPAPALWRIVGFHHRMGGRPKVFGGVLADGLVTASDVAADPADPQMDPVLADLQAFFAPIRRGRDPRKLIQVRAAHFSPFERVAAAQFRGGAA